MTANRREFVTAALLAAAGPSLDPLCLAQLSPRASLADAAQGVRTLLRLMVHRGTLTQELFSKLERIAWAIVSAARDDVGSYSQALATAEPALRAALEMSLIYGFSVTPQTQALGDLFEGTDPLLPDEA